MKKRNLVIILLVIIIIPILYFLPPIQKGINLMMYGDVVELVAWIRSWGVIAPIISVFLMVLQAVVAPLPSFIITGANGMVFGILWGVVISWVGAMLGAIVTFYLAKIFGKAIIPKKQQDKQWLKKLEQFNGKHGFIIVLIARVVPVVSFDFISYAAGFTRMKVTPFLLATGVGMFPATVIYTIIGHDFLQLEDYLGRIIFLIILLALMMVVGLWVRNKYLRRE